MKPRYGIFGGSFDPVHLGHLILAESAREQFELERVFFMPCAQQPLKQGRRLASAEHRKRMLEAAIEDEPAFELLTMELERGGVSYAVDSVDAIRREYPEADLFFLIGADTVETLPQWKHIERLARMCRFLVFPRPGSLMASAGADTPLPAGMHLVQAPVPRRIEISSSDIRYRVAEGLSIRYMVPREVEMIISEHSLYR